jgi:hypothetical protein
MGGLRLCRKGDEREKECDESSLTFIGFRGGALSCAHLKPSLCLSLLLSPANYLFLLAASPTMFDEDCCLQCGKPMPVDK